MQRTHNANLIIHFFFYYLIIFIYFFFHLIVIESNVGCNFNINYSEGERGREQNHFVFIVLIIYFYYSNCDCHDLTHQHEGLQLSNRTEDPKSANFSAKQWRVLSDLGLMAWSQIHRKIISNC